MVLWWIALAGICIAAWWLITRRLAWRFSVLAFRLRRLAQRPQRNRTAGKQSMLQLYKILQTCLTDGRDNEVYQALDLLKFALGNGLGTAAEAVRLASVVYFAVRVGRFDVASHILDAFRPLLKNLPPAEMPPVIEQLGLLAVMSLKQRQNFLAARTMEILFGSAGHADPAVRKALLRAIRLTGLLALKRNDAGLIREIQTKLECWLATEPDGSLLSEQIAHIVAAWLHRVVKTGNVPLFELITGHMEQLAEKELLSPQALCSLILECIPLSVMDSLNPLSELSGQVAAFSLDLAAKTRDITSWRHALQGVMQAARLAVNQRSLTESFMVIYPLLETGRSLLATELTASPRQDTFRQQALHILLSECWQLIEFISRQNFTTTLADIIEQIYQEWLACPQNAGQHKSIRRFCQLLFLYCTRPKRRQKNLVTEADGFNAENVISLANHEHLKQLGYL